MIGTSLGSGTKTYNLNFCKYLNNLEIKDQVYIFISTNYFNDLSTIHNPKIKYIIKSGLFSNIIFRFLWLQFFLPFKLRKLKVNKFYSPMNYGPLLLSFFNIQFILALHSNLPWVFFSKMPGNFIRNTLVKFLMELSINACDILIVDSDFAKKEIVEILNIKKEKVVVIYLGIDAKYLNDNNQQYLKDFNYKNYILSVLSCVRYHNIIDLLKGFKLFKRENLSNLSFVLVLQVLDKNYFLQVQRYIKSNFLENEIIFMHDLNNDYLVNLYKKADLYIFTSYCEVFGLTSLEAMSQGCPVFISNRSAIPEINSDAVDYFNPDNPIEIKNGIKKILSNHEHRKNLIDKGSKHFQKFNWDKTVKDTLEILEN